MSPAELGSVAQPDEQGLPIAMPLSEPLEALPGAERAATPEPADDPSRTTRYKEDPSGKKRLRCNFVEDGK